MGVVGGIPRSFCMAQKGVGTMFCGRTFHWYARIPSLPHDSQTIVLLGGDWSNSINTGLVDHLGKMRKSAFEYACRVTLPIKKDGSQRFCGDYRPQIFRWNKILSPCF